MLLMGMILIAIGVSFMIYNVMKRRAPAKRTERPTEAADVTFYPEAAIDRYLASKKNHEDSAIPPAATLAARPVFGRRSGATSHDQ